MQTNIQPGEVVFPAYTDLKGREGHLAIIVNASGVAKVTTPTQPTDQVLYVLTDCHKGTNAPASCLPLSGTHNVRVWLVGTCNPGDVLVLEPAGPSGVGGKVKTVPEIAGTYRMVGIAEEAGVNGQCVLMRPRNELVTVTE